MSVTLSLRGGAGNQLFIRAMGYAFEAVGNEVFFDRSPLDHDDTRAYTLDRFNTEVPFGPRKGQTIWEPNLRYHPELLKKYDTDVTFDGYWQCERYWTPEVQGTIRKAFTLRNPPSDRSLAIAREIQNSDSVFYHVRRTDSLSARGLINHGVCSSEYYKAAIDYIAVRVQDPHYFVFSDDIAWCKANVSLPKMTFVDCNTTGVTESPEHEVRKTDNGTEHEDLALMAACKHAIIANSSFGFWGAWLIKNPDKIVITPKQWFTPRSPHTSEDMVPSGWQRL